ncbi:MAG TPA: hypothetical protein VGE12_17700 [Noviherbaspirillum sp.]
MALIQIDRRKPLFLMEEQGEFAQMPGYGAVTRFCQSVRALAVIPASRLTIRVRGPFGIR